MLQVLQAVEHGLVVPAAAQLPQVSLLFGGPGFVVFVQFHVRLLRVVGFNILIESDFDILAGLRPFSKS